jgi:hypothetical protein
VKIRHIPIIANIEHGKSTLVICDDEFARTIFWQGELATTSCGRDHHRCCRTMWMAGADVNPASPGRDRRLLLQHRP